MFSFTLCIALKGSIAPIGLAAFINSGLHKHARYMAYASPTSGQRLLYAKWDLNSWSLIPGDLNRHLRSIHLQVKPLMCGHCHKKFAKEATLIRHMRTSHREMLLQSVLKG